MPSRGGFIYLGLGNRRSFTCIASLIVQTVSVLPQFDLRDPKADSADKLIRARSGEEAVRLWLDLPHDIDVTLRTPEAPMEALEGWKAVFVDDVYRGRIRPHQRMRFRRD